MTERKLTIYIEGPAGSGKTRWHDAIDNLVTGPAPFDLPKADIVELANDNRVVVYAGASISEADQILRLQAANAEMEAGLASITADNVRLGQLVQDHAAEIKRMDERCDRLNVDRGRLDRELRDMTKERDAFRDDRDRWQSNAYHEQRKAAYFSGQIDAFVQAGLVPAKAPKMVPAAVDAELRYDEHRQWRP